MRPIHLALFQFRLFLCSFISFTFQGSIQYLSFCSGRTPGALVKTIKYSKFRIICVISVCNLTLPLTLPYHTSYLTLPYITLHLTLHYLTLPYLNPTYLMSYLTSYFTLPYVLLYLTLCLTFLAHIVT